MSNSEPLYRIKPLVWEKSDYDDRSVVSHIPLDRFPYEVWFHKGKSPEWLVGGGGLEDSVPCGSLENGKRLAQQHWGSIQGVGQLLEEASPASTIGEGWLDAPDADGYWWITHAADPEVPPVIVCVTHYSQGWLATWHDTSRCCGLVCQLDRSRKWKRIAQEASPSISPGNPHNAD